MSMQAWVEPFVNAGEDGAAYANSTSVTSLLPTGRRVMLSSTFFDNPGKTLRFRASGRISTTGTPTIKFTLQFGSVVVFDGGAVTTASGITNLTWIFEADLVCRSIGSGTSATMLGTGKLYGVNTATGLIMLPASAPAVGTGFDSTAAQTVDLMGTWGTASASNTLTLHQFSLLALN